MAINYMPDDLKTWLRADPQFGPQWTFLLSRMARLGHALKVEYLIGRDFDGTSTAAFVSTGAKDRGQETAWSADALREWDGCGCSTDRMYFMDVARQWAREGPGNSFSK